MPNKRKAPQLSAGETLSTQWSSRMGLPLWGSSWESVAGGLWGPCGRPASRCSQELKASLSPRPPLDNDPGGAFGAALGKQEQRMYSLSSLAVVLVEHGGLGMEAWSRGPTTEEMTVAAASTLSAWRPGA